MAYTGTSVAIPLGQMGLHTDDPFSEISPSAGIKANNVSLYRNRLEKAAASLRYNTLALSSSIVSAFDWWPTPTSQRMIALTADGKAWRDSGDKTFSTATPIATGLGALTPDCHMVAGGALTSSDPKKLFIYTGGVSAMQVLSGDASTIAPIFRTAADWLTSYPTYGLIFQGRHVAFGNSTAPHTLYVSRSDDHADFRLGSGATVQFSGGSFSGVTNAVTLTLTTPSDIAQIDVGMVLHVSTTGVGSPPSAGWSTDSVTVTAVSGGAITGTSSVTPSNTLSTPWTGINYLATANGYVATDAIIQTCFSGEGDRLVGGIVYKGALVLFKKPFGVYLCTWDGASSALSITRFSDAFGLASPHAASIVLDDLLGFSTAASLTSLKATNAYGSLEQGDVLSTARVRDGIRQLIDTAGLATMSSIYYPEKQVAYFTARSPSAPKQDSMVVVDAANAQAGPRVTWSTKDQATCLALRKDANGVQRPIYGANDGYVYLMDQTGYNVAGAPYVGEFQTTSIDFSYMDGSLAGKVKIFDFLELSYNPTGAWDFYVDVYVDGAFAQTLTYVQRVPNALGPSFIMGTSLLGGSGAQHYRRPIQCSGRTISFRVYNSGLDQSFSVERMIVGFRLSAEQNRSSRT